MNHFHLSHECRTCGECYWAMVRAFGDDDYPPQIIYVCQRCGAIHRVKDKRP